MPLTRMLRSAFLLTIAVVVSLTLASCDDDNGSSGPDDPDIAENEASASLSGAADAEITPDEDIEVEVETDDNNNDNTLTELSVSWDDANNNEVNVTITTVGNSIGTGTYDVLSSLTNAPKQFSEVSVIYNGTSWNYSGESGSVAISTNNDNRVAGTINDVTLDNPDPEDEAQVTINGKFNALKDSTSNSGSNDDAANIVNLTGDEQEDIKARSQPDYQLGGSAINITWQGESNITNTVSIGIRGLGKTDTGTAIASTKLSPSERPDQAVDLTVTYEGTDYETVDQSGDVEVTTNTDSRIEGTINAIELEAGGKSVTANGSFAVDK